MVSVFINYRRDDSRGWSVHVHRALTQELPVDDVFMDVTSLEGGVDFRDEIVREAGGARVLLAMIGPHWNPPDDAGRRRLDDPSDYLRAEIAAALAEDRVVIPVLIDGTEMPSPGDLPGDLKELAFKNAHELESRDYDSQTEALVQLVSRTLADRPEPVVRAEMARHEEALAQLRLELEALIASHTEVKEREVGRALRAAKGEFDAFISYSAISDEPLARTIESGLHDLGRSWTQRRALSVFRDSSTLSAGPDLWETMEAALAASRYLIVILSPASAQSEWVSREIEQFLRYRSPDELVLVLADGVLVWDADRADWDPDTSSFLPRALSGVFDHEPMWLDMRWLSAEGGDGSMGDPRFRQAIAHLAAPLHGLASDDLLSEDLRLINRRRRLARAAVAGLTAVAISAVGLLLVVLL